MEMEIGSRNNSKNGKEKENIIIIAINPEVKGIFA
jgi:hypothetical protein